MDNKSLNSVEQMLSPQERKLKEIYELKEKFILDSFALTNKFGEDHERLRNEYKEIVKNKHISKIILPKDVAPISKRFKRLGAKRV